MTTISFLLFREACKHHGGLRLQQLTVFDKGHVCREGYNPKRCYQRRCPLLKKDGKNAKT